MIRRYDRGQNTAYEHRVHYNIIYTGTGAFENVKVVMCTFFAKKVTIYKVIVALCIDWQITWLPSLFFEK